MDKLYLVPPRSLVGWGRLQNLMNIATEPVSTFVLRLRTARRKAREAAIAEVVAVLRDLGARPAVGGPMAEAKGVAWVTVPARNAAVAIGRLLRLGYTEAVEQVLPIHELDLKSPPVVVRWRRSEVALLRVYEESDEAVRAGAPDRRTFSLECGDGVVRPIVGYRGGPGPLEHRALPVEDARLLVNLVATPGRGLLLDPFAGAGGAIIEARATGWDAISIDIDRTLRFGLAELASLHLVGDAAALPFPDSSIDAIASEPPHHPSATAAVAASVNEVARVLRSGARASFLIASHQAGAVRQAAEEAGLTVELDTRIDRKGTDVSCFCWVR